MRLEEHEFIDFHKTYFNILLFAGLKKNLLPAGTTFEGFENLAENKKFLCREALNEHPDLFTTYLETKSKELSAEALTTLHGLTKKITAEFIVFKYLAEHAIFIDLGKSKVYGIKSLSNPLSNILPYAPIMIKATILPYRDKIIYDGFCQSYPVTFGRGLKSNFTEIYNKAKKSNSIITTIN